MVQSWHAQLIFSNEENEPDFEKAWGLQAAREKGANIPKHCRDPRALQYRRVGFLGEQVERLYATFERGKVEVLLQEEMAADPKPVYEETLRFLEVPSDGRNDFPVLNESKVSHNSVLDRAMAQPPDILINMARWTKKRVGLKDVQILPAIRRALARKKGRPPLSDNFRHSLVDEFKPDIVKLESLIGRDLSHWYSIPSPN